MTLSFNHHFPLEKKIPCRLRLRDSLGHVTGRRRARVPRQMQRGAVRASAGQCRQGGSGHKLGWGLTRLAPSGLLSYVCFYYYQFYINQDFGWLAKVLVSKQPSASRSELGHWSLWV